MTGSAKRRSAYDPPERWEQIEAREVGITNGLSLDVPYLYLAGDRSLLEQPGVAVVGSRKVTEDGARRAIQLARELARNGVVVVSGLAEGIDYHAHRAALENGGRTIAVVGTPLDKAYPIKHAALQQQIYREHLLISPFRHGERTYPSSFPLRNKVMARITRATVIIEASDTSGTLHQAAECDRQGRPLFIARSVLDDPKLTWPQRFKSAKPMDTPDDVLSELF